MNKNRTCSIINCHLSAPGGGPPTTTAHRRRGRLHRDDLGPGGAFGTHGLEVGEGGRIVGWFVEGCLLDVFGLLAGYLFLFFCFMVILGLLKVFF